MNAHIAQLIENGGDLGNLRREVLAQITSLLENQTRANIFAANISELSIQVHRLVLDTLEAELASPVPRREAIKQAVSECRKLDASLKFLFAERKRQWDKNSEYLKEILREFHETIGYLSTTLVDRDLFERQSHVLEQIILSHERVTNWKEFIQELLMGFHSIFPFDIFFIVFAEKQYDAALYIYYFGKYKEEIKTNVREKLTHELLGQLQLHDEANLDIEEYQVSDSGASIILEDIQMITVAVPDHSTNLAGLLGLAFASMVTLTDQERSIIRALLSVMVMVVGSSKQLSGTLEELEYYSNHDPLTKLYNRRFFTDMLEYEVGRAERHRHEFCVLLLDLDNFKDINDSYGHPTGDSTLVLIAETLRQNLRKGDIATRIGGDEFAIILPESSAEGGRKVAENILRKLQEVPFSSEDGKTYRVTTSIGLACFPKDAATPSDLMSVADIALYHAKDLGKNEVSTLDLANRHATVARGGKIFAEELREDMESGRMVPFYQPIINCRTGEVFANEALARIRKPDGTVVNAGSFIETISKYGLARELDKVILSKALAATMEHMCAAGTPTKIFVNLSPQEIQSRGILALAESLCNELGLPPSCVVFELLERDAIGDMSHMGKFLASLRDKGFGFALDDFGSGYNSFHYLRELHFDYVKIDGAFVHNILNSHVDRALVRNLSHLCQDLQILTVAEYVESEEILHMLQDMGINYAQGYGIALPTPTLSCAPYAGNLYTDLPL